MSDAIREVLAKYLPPAGTVLEVASGSGEHAAFFAKAVPDLTWQPSERTPEQVTQIASRVEQASLTNLLPPIELDFSNPPWSIGRADAVLCIDTLHTVPMEATAGLFSGVAKLLAPNGLL